MKPLEILEMWQKSLVRDIKTTEDKYKWLKEYCGLLEELEDKDLIVSDQDVNDNEFERDYNGKQIKDVCNNPDQAHYDNRSTWERAELECKKEKQELFDLEKQLEFVQSIIKEIKRKAHAQMYQDMNEIES